MPIEIRKVENKNELKKFIIFPQKLYKDCPYYVPQLIYDEVDTFSKSKNPSFKVCESQLFLAYKDEKIVGRIAAIINKPANLKYGTKDLRFNWIDFIEDYEVAKALLDTAIEWGKSQGMTTITGPHGFSDLDPQGMLIEGYDKLATIAGFYNFPYYQEYLEKYGFEKEIDFVEFLSFPPYDEGVPEKMLRASEWVMKKYNFHLLDYKTAKQYKQRGNEIFSLLEETFDENYGTVPLTKEQVDYYIKKYISFINPELIKIVVDEKDEMIGFMITMPSLSKAFQKMKGKLLPFGFLHIMKAMKTYETIDFYLAGVKKEYRGRGVDLVMVVDIIKSVMKLGFKYVESNQELENNTKVQSEWKFFKPIQHKRRRIFKKNI